MKFFVLTAAFLLSSGTSLHAGQSSSSGSQATPDTATAAVQTSADARTEKPKTKPKKVWTNDEISGAGGEGAISVVGKAGGGDRNPPSNNFQKSASGSAARDKQAAAYRDRLRHLHSERESVDKKISQLRNFKADD